MWIVNKYGWIGNGNIDQCICINIREGGNASNPNPIYPINYNWVDNLGSDSIGILDLTRDAMNLRRNCVKTDRVQIAPVVFA